MRQTLISCDWCGARISTDTGVAISASLEFRNVGAVEFVNTVKAEDLCPACARRVEKALSEAQREAT